LNFNLKLEGIVLIE